MAIYETNSHHCLANNKNHSSSNGGGATCFVLKAAMALVFAGPKQLLPNVRRDPYALLNSSDDHWMATLQASISLTLWCLGLIAAVSGKGKYLMSRSSSCRTSSSSGSSKKYGVSGGTTSSPPPTRRQQQQQGALASDTWMQRREDDAVTAAARVVTACLRQLVLRAVQATATMTSLTLLLQQRRTAAQEQDDDDDLTLTVHSGSCQCGAVQFRVRMYSTEDFYIRARAVRVLLLLFMQMRLFLLTLYICMFAVFFGSSKPPAHCTFKMISKVTVVMMMTAVALEG